MGAYYRSASSIGLLVLLAVTALAPLVGASDIQRTLEETATGAQSTADDARRGAEREASQQKDEADEVAAETQSKAEKHFADLQAWALDVMGDVQREVQERLGNLPLARQAERPSQQTGSVSAASTEYAIGRPGVTAPLMWVTASVSGLVVLFVAVRKLIGLGAIPLLSRIAHSDIYNNDARRTIHELVVNEPGQCLNELVGRTGYSRNAVSYHLFVLEKEEEIVSVKDGKYRRYFTRNGKYVNGAKNVVAALRNETTLKLAKVVLERPGAIQRDLCVELGATPSATCWHAKRLLDLGVIRKERVANTVKYYPGEAMAKYDLSDMGLPRIQPDASPAPTPAA